MMYTDYQSLITEAIKAKKILFIQYEKETTERAIHPYAIYESTVGNIDLYSIQMYNPAKPADKDKPRVFTLKSLTSVRISNTAFHVKLGYSPKNIKNCTRIIISV